MIEEHQNEKFQENNLFCYCYYVLHLESINGRIFNIYHYFNNVSV